MIRSDQGITCTRTLYVDAQKENKAEAGSGGLDSRAIVCGRAERMRGRTVDVAELKLLG